MMANVAIKLAQILILPIITKELSPSDFGIADLLQTFYGLLLPILIMGFDSAFGAFHFEEDSDLYRSKVFNTIFFHLFASSLVAIALMFFAEPISSLLFQTPKYALGVRIALGVVVVNLWIVPFSQLMRMEKKMKKFSAITLVGSLSLLMSNFYLVTVAHWGYLALILSIFISYLLQLILFFFGIRPKMGKKYFDKELYKSIAKYALPFLPMLIVVWILNMSDRFLLNYFLGPDPVGIYGIAARFQSILAMVISAIFATFSAFAFSNRKEEEAAESFVFVHNVLHLVLLAMAFFVSLFVEEFLRILVDSKFHQAAVAIPPLLYGQVFYASHIIFSYGFAFKKKSTLNFWPALLGASVNLVLNYIFIPTYGVGAAAYTTLIGYGLMMSLTYYLAQRISPIPYHAIWTIGTSLATFAICVIMQGSPLFIRTGAFLLAALAIAFLYRKTLKGVGRLLAQRIREN